MTGAADTCRHVRLHVGADPHSLPADVEAHLATCADCRRFRDETLMLDGRVRAALELPLIEFRTPLTAPVVVPSAPRGRRVALAASVALGMLMAGGFWLLKPQPALAGEVVEHALEESGSWGMKAPVQASYVADVLHMAGVQFDTRRPVVYAAPCIFQGRRIAHLVVQTESGPLTVMLLPHQSLNERREFSENGMHGVLLPAGAGAIAVIVHGAGMPAGMDAELVSSVRW